MDARALPENDIESTRDKINCFNAESFRLDEQIAMLQTQKVINREHVGRLYQRLEKLIFAKQPSPKYGDRPSEGI